MRHKRRRGLFYLASATFPAMVHASNHSNHKIADQLSVTDGIPSNNSHISKSTIGELQSLSRILKQIDSRNELSADAIEILDSLENAGSRHSYDDLTMHTSWLDEMERVVDRKIKQVGMRRMLTDSSHERDSDHRQQHRLETYRPNLRRGIIYPKVEPRVPHQQQHQQQQYQKRSVRKLDESGTIRLGNRSLSGTKSGKSELAVYVATYPPASSPHTFDTSNGDNDNYHNDDDDNVDDDDGTDTGDGGLGEEIQYVEDYEECYEYQHLEYDDDAGYLFEDLTPVIIEGGGDEHGDKNSEDKGDEDSEKYEVDHIGDSDKGDDDKKDDDDKDEGEKAEDDNDKEDNEEKDNDKEDEEDEKEEQGSQPNESEEKDEEEDDAVGNKDDDMTSDAGDISTEMPSVASATTSPSTASETASPTTVLDTASPTEAFETASPTIASETASPTPAPSIGLATPTPSIPATITPSVASSTVSPSIAQTSLGPSIVSGTASPSIASATTSPTIPSTTTTTTTILTPTASPTLTLRKLQSTMYVYDYAKSGKATKSAKHHISYSSSSSSSAMADTSQHNDETTLPGSNVDFVTIPNQHHGKSSKSASAKSGKTKSGKRCFIIKKDDEDDVRGGYCGKDYHDAALNCEVKCNSDADCSGEDLCFDGISECSPKPKDEGEKYCGEDFTEASKCADKCDTDSDCPNGESCYSDVTECAKEEKDQYCGTDEEDATKCATKCESDDDCPGDESCFSDISGCSEGEDNIQPTSAPTPTSCPDGCLDCDPEAPLLCPPPELKRVCDKHNNELYPLGDPREGEREANFIDCYEICKPSFCCIHDSASKEYAPSCSHEFDNCPLYYPCYIIWWKLHDTIGPATYMRVEQDEPFYEGVKFEYFQEDFAEDQSFFQQLFGHHFDVDDAPTDDTFENEENW